MHWSQPFFCLFGTPPRGHISHCLERGASQHMQNIAKPSKCTNLLVEYCFRLKRNLVSLSIPTDYRFKQMLTHTIARKFNFCRPCKSSSFASNTDTSAFIRRSSSFAGRATCGTCCSDKAFRTIRAVLRVLSRWDSA